MVCLLCSISANKRWFSCCNCSNDGAETAVILVINSMLLWDLLYQNNAHFLYENHHIELKIMSKIKRWKLSHQSEIKPR